MQFGAQEQSYGLVKKGEYEATLEKIVAKETQGGRKHLSFQFRIRTDVEQECGNRVLFESIWTSKDDNETYSEGAVKRINSFLFAAGYSKDEKFNSLVEVMQALENKHMGIRVNEVMNDYQGEMENKIGWAFPTRFKAQELGESNEPLNINSDDLPF